MRGMLCCGIVQFRIVLAVCQVKDWWTPSDQAILDDNDLDFGSSAPIPVLDDQFLFVGGKEGTLYLLNTTNLGGYNPNNSDANAVSVVEANKKEISGTNGIYRCAAAASAEEVKGCWSSSTGAALPLDSWERTRQLG